MFQLKKQANNKAALSRLTQGCLLFVPSIERTVICVHGQRRRLSVNIPSLLALTKTWYKYVSNHLIHMLRTYIIFNAKGSLYLTIRLVKHKVLLDQRF